jgi:hypothetical protein
MKRVAGIFLGLAVAGCDDGHLRGSVEPSVDGETYLAVMDDNGGKCGPIKVDGAVWPFRIGEPGRIAPGVHSIECGTGNSFEIPKSVVFRFDYWGP